MELEFRESFLRDIKHIREKGVKKKIAALIVETKAASSLSAIRNVKKMEGSEDYYRVRIGIKVHDKTLIFLRCLHRKDIYRYFP